MLQTICTYFKDTPTRPHMHVCTHTHTYVCMHTHTCTHNNTHVCMACMHIHTHVHIHAYACIYTCTNICMASHTDTYIHAYIQIHNLVYCRANYFRGYKIQKFAINKCGKILRLWTSCKIFTGHSTWRPKNFLPCVTTRICDLRTSHLQDIFTPTIG